MLTEDLLFRRFIRDRSPENWEELLLQYFDYVGQRVAAFRFPGGQFVPDFEQGTVTGMAWMRVKGMEFRGSSIGELRGAIAKTVWNTCMDWGRRRLAYERHIAGSLDEPGFEQEESDRGRYEPQIAEISRRREAEAEQGEEEAELRESQIALVRWAIRRVDNDNYREVLYMTHVERADAATIAKRLDIKEANVYQRRRRGNLELERILRDQRT
jgi:RNA polymerase sigma factor (sigma-70 family)